jgi:hypothetical protein
MKDVVILIVVGIVWLTVCIDIACNSILHRLDDLKEKLEAIESKQKD